jgi:hypothetical protein
VKKLGSVVYPAFRRNSESNIFNAIKTSWTPVFTGVTTKKEFFHTFGKCQGGGESEGGIFDFLQDQNMKVAESGHYLAFFWGEKSGRNLWQRFCIKIYKIEEE